MKISLLVISICCCLFASGQWLPSVFSFDTVYYANRTGGKLDSLDMILNRFSGTSPAGNIELPYTYPTPDFFWKYKGGMRTSYEKNESTIRFSAVPHIGFGYVFGSKGTQVAKMDYQQVFSKSILVNFNFLNDRSNGFLRNSAHKLNDASLSILRKGKVYSFELNAMDRNFSAGLNGGISEIADPNSFPMVFLPVQKENALSEIRHTNIDLTNYFDFNKDSTKSAGLLLLNKLAIDQRRFTEDATLFGLYDQINYDSLFTNDSYQLSRTEHGLGGYFRANKLFVSANFSAAYWKYFNFGEKMDTLETALSSRVKYNGSKWKIDYSLIANLSGAKNEWRTKLLIIGKFGTVNWRSSLKAESILPDVFQRSYFGNNFQYHLDQYQKQFRGFLENEAQFQLSNIDMKIWQRSVLLKNNYFFQDTIWSTSVHPSISVHQIGLRAGYTFRALSIHPEYNFMISSGINKIVPAHVFRARFLVKGALFKSKKMIAYVGTDICWVSESNAMRFLPAMDLYEMSSPTYIIPSMFNLHVFGGFQIDEFRFFMRFENIGYNWNSHEIEQVENYPIPSGVFRVGITWDFFN